MKRLLFALLAVLMLFFTACQEAPSGQDEPAGQTTPSGQEVVPGEQVILPYRFADKEEGISLLKGNADYYNGFTKNDLEYRLQKKGGQVEEWLSFACEQVREFSDADKAVIDSSINRIRNILDEKGYVLPPIDEIVFVKTTMMEEMGATAYTHGTQIYIGEFLLSLQMQDENGYAYFDYVMCHEIFHCLTRNNPQFRRDMYDIIGFTVAEEEFELSPAVLENYISNPDVGRHDSYAEFTIDGKKMNCFTVFITTEPFEKEGDLFFDTATTGLVPIDDPDTIYTMEDATDFWDVFGQNTGYVIDPEECLADNFGYTIVFGNTDAFGEPLKSPHITEAIDAYLRGVSG